MKFRSLSTSDVSGWRAEQPSVVQRYAVKFLNEYGIGIHRIVRVKALAESFSESTIETVMEKSFLLHAEGRALIFVGGSNSNLLHAPSYFMCLSTLSERLVRVFCVCALVQPWVMRGRAPIPTRWVTEHTRSHRTAKLKHCFSSLGRCPLHCTTRNI